MVRIVTKSRFVIDLVTSTGTHVPVSFNATPYRGPDGAIQGVFAVARDLSPG